LPIHRASRTAPAERARPISRAHLGYRLCRNVKLIRQTPAVDRQRLEAEVVVHLHSLSPSLQALVQMGESGVSSDKSRSIL
jgi:hypothetical protein